MRFIGEVKPLLWGLNLHFVREMKRTSYAGLRQTEEVSSCYKKQQQALQPSSSYLGIPIQGITNSPSGLVEDQDGFC